MSYNGYDNYLVGKGVEIAHNAKRSLCRWFKLDCAETDPNLYLLPDWISNKHWNPKNQPLSDPNQPINIDVPPPNQPINDNRVYYSSQTIYIEQNIFIQNNLDSLPSKPGSNLNVEQGEEQSGQTATKVVIGSPITLAQSIKNQQFGQMLFNPFSDQKRTIRVVDSEGAAEELEQLIDTGIEKFAKAKADEPEATLTDEFALITPTFAQGNYGADTIIFGLDSIKYLATYNHASSLTALSGVYDTIPNGYELEEFTPQYQESNSTFAEIELIGEVDPEELEPQDVVSIVASDRDARYIKSQVLILHFVTLDNYPKRAKNSAYRQVQIPAPKESYDWLEDFDSLRWYQGNLYAELHFQENYVPVSGFFENETRANQYFDAVLTLTTATQKDRVIYKHYSPNTNILVRETRPYRAFIKSVNELRQAVCHATYRPPINVN